MIVSFKDKDSEKLFHRIRVKRFQSFEQQALKLLTFLNAASSLEAIKANPSNKLHALGGDMRGQFAIWINAQWQICFEWREGNAHEVTIVDYH